MNGRVIIKNWFTRPALVGAALAVLCGLLLWWTPLGVPWENASYDCLYKFGTHTNPLPVVIVQMDAGGERNIPEERRRHTRLLEKMTDDGARLVVFDVHFQSLTESATDEALAAAIRRNGQVVLMADLKKSKGYNSTRKLDSASLDPPHPIFLSAAAGSGVGRAAVSSYALVRRHWPILAPGEGPIYSLGWAAAEVFGAHLDSTVGEQWLRYYGKNGPGVRVEYADAFTKEDGFFRDQIVFIGNWPEEPDDPRAWETVNDKYSTPYTRLHLAGAVGGVEIMATTFLNLVNGDWLRRPAAWKEFLLLVLTGFLLGGGLCQLRRPEMALLVAVGIFFAVLCVFVSWSYFSNWWFPWLVIAGGQLPLAWAWAWAVRIPKVAFAFERHPGYVEMSGTFGEGAFGNVRVVRNVTGQLQALKEVVLAKFKDAGPYEREFRGVKNYKPVSNEHTGLLHVDYVNRNEADGYFYYVMDLGDAMDPGWEKNGGKYEPRDLRNALHAAEGKRLPVRECFRIAINLLDALDFLHQRPLVHGDIKPANIVFVNGRPKLADVGLVREASPDSTMMGTPGYMVPPPEPTGTKVADIYSMGKVLYVISTGNDVNSFSQLSTTLVARPEFMRLNEIICRAAHPLADQRYADAAEMLAAVRAAQAELDGGQTQKM